MTKNFFVRTAAAGIAALVSLRIRRRRHLARRNGRHLPAV